MTQALLGGLVSGSIYALLGLGIVLVFSVSRFVNLAQGEFYVYGALIATTLVAAGMPVAFAVVVATLAVAVIAAAVDRAVFARLVNAPHAAQLLAGIGVAFAMAGVARAFWGTEERSLPQLWTRPPIEVLGARVSIQAIVLFATLAALCGLLWFLLHRTLLGTSMRAVAALSSRAGLLAINVRSVTTIAFAVSGAAGAIAGVIVTPLVFVSFHSGLLLTVYGFIAAAFGGLRSIRGAVVGGLLVGVFEAFTAYYGDSALKTPIAFSLLVVVLVYRARREGATSWLRAGMATRRASTPPLPEVAARPFLQRILPGRASLLGIAAVLAFAALGPSVLSPYAISVWSFIGVFVIVGLGLDLLLGYTGQLSLGQTTFMGVAAYLVVLAVDWWSLPTWGAVAFAIIGTALLAGALGALVLRLRGYYFTLATLAVAIAAEALANGLPEQLGGPSGLGVPTTLSFAGFVIGTPTRLFVLTWIVVAVSLLVALRIARSRFGQGMRAVGFDEELASAAAVPPFSVKLKVFVASSIFAGVAGVLYAHILLFVSPPILGFAAGFDAVVGLLLGGFGTVWGALVGIPIVRLLPQIGERFAEYQQLIYGVAVIVLVLLLPEGVVGGARRLVSRTRRTGGAVADGDSVPAADRSDRRDPGATREPVTPTVRPQAPGLQATGISKHFGGLTALTNVDLAVRPGQILGLIGPNGAGKSTCLNLLAGSLPSDTGHVSVSGVDVTRLPAETRAAMGLARTFQLPHLPAAMTVLDVAMLGAFRCGRSGLLRAVGGAIAVEQDGVRQAARRALAMTGIDGLAHTSAAKLSTGDQKLLELARALASSPQVLLADEPAGGLFDEELGRLADVLRRLAAEGLAIVLVEHEMRLVMEVCDEIVVLNEGRVIGAGCPADVRANREVRDAYLGV